MTDSILRMKRTLDSALRIVAAIGFLAVAAVLVRLEDIPSMRSFFVLAFLLAAVRPWWGIVSIAFLGPLSLLAPGSTHRLVQTDLFVLGALFGHLLRHPLLASPTLQSSPNAEPDSPSVTSTCWPHLGWLIAFGALAALVPGLQLIFGTPEGGSPFGHGPVILAAEVFFNYATTPWWPLRSAFNWITGLLLAWVVFREATPRRLQTLFSLAFLGTVSACLAGLGDHLHLWSLDAWRRPNPDIFHTHFHRLNGLAGHAGWLAEWIILTGPAVLVLWGGGRRRKAVLTLATVLIGFTLLLTLARAGWLAALVILILYTLLRIPSGFIPWKRVAQAVVLLAVITVAALLINRGPLVERISHIADVRDRLNYFASTVHILREHPLGIGLGMHSLVYEARFTPLHRFYQLDHTTAHNTWLHLLVEQGPVQAALVAFGFLALIFTAGRAWIRADPQRRPLLFALLLILVGLAVESLAQYLAFIRVVEVMIWILAGSVLALSRRTRAPQPSSEPQESGTGPASTFTSSARLSSSLLGLLFLAAGGAWAAYLAAHHAKHDAAHPFPRFIIHEPDTQSIAIWTDSIWRFPLDSAWCGIEFNLISTTISQDLTVLLPDNDPYRLHLKPDEQRGLWFAFHPDRQAGPFEPLRWMEIRCARTWTPREQDNASTDPRRLGVYVFSLRPFYCDDDPRRPDTQTWTESIGGTVPALPPPENSPQGIK